MLHVKNEPVGTGLVAFLLCTRLNYCPLGLARKQQLLRKLRESVIKQKRTKVKEMEH